MGNGNELDYGVLAEADRLIVDDLDYAALVGDGAAWIAQGWLTPNSFAQRVDALAADVVAGRSPGRRSEDDRVVALIQGMATGDVAFAHLALTRAEASSLGQVVDLMSSER
jgi:ornithine cyclodeaminase